MLYRTRKLRNLLLVGSLHNKIYMRNLIIYNNTQEDASKKNFQMGKSSKIFLVIFVRQKRYKIPTKYGIFDN